MAMFIGLLIAWPFLFGGINSDFLTLGPWGKLPLLAFVICVVLMAAWSPTRDMVTLLIERLRPMPARRRFWSSIAVGAFAAVYLTVTAFGQHRPRYPYFHDECSYLIQAHQFAVGRLWEPAHALPEFFDSFQLFSEPVYASAYFPGTAILYVPGIWLHLPPWVTSVLIAAVVAGLLFRITAELLDGAAAVLAVTLLFANDAYRQSATLAMGQMPCLMYGLLAILFWLRWSARPTARRAVLIGIALGLAAVTRPVDALIFAIPIAAAIFFGAPWSVRVKTAAGIAAGLLPFLLLQVVMNRGITGEYFRTPFRMYADRDYPGTAYGFHTPDPAAEPVSKLLQKRMLYDGEYSRIIAGHRWSNVIRQQFEPLGVYSPARFQSVFIQSTVFAYPLLMLLIPLSVLAMTRRRAVVVAGGPLFWFLYVPYVFFFFHYVLTAAAGMIVAILVGGRGAEILLPRWRKKVMVAVFLFTGGLSLAAWPQFDPDVTDVAFDSTVLAKVNTALARLPAGERAVVLFTFDPKRGIHSEPVYNTDAAWPDDEPVVRAHDLGPRDPEIFRYYADRQPDRVFYRYDERNGELMRLGTATELAKNNPV
jgi:hypothetical protein